jgi:carboxypeptidase PM20D1
VQVSSRESVAPPAPSDLDSAAGRVLTRTIRAHFPDAVIVPSCRQAPRTRVTSAASPEQIFRFLPVHLSSEDLASMHGVNERISTASLARAYAFYAEYLRAIGR